MKFQLLRFLLNKLQHIVMYDRNNQITPAGQGGPKGFCVGEPQNRDVTDVVSKVPTKPSKFWSPQDKGSNLDLSRIAHFSVHFYSHRNQIALSIYGDTSFSPSFLRSIVYFKAISHISGSKKWSKQSVTDAGRDAGTHGQTHIKILRPPAQKPFGQ